MKTAFRSLRKERVVALLPRPLRKIVHRKAIDENRSVSSVVTEACVEYFGLDPSDYGLLAQSAESAPSIK